MMTEISQYQVEDCACLHKQITEWVVCCHHPRHTDLADAVIHALATRDPVTRRVVRAETAGRRMPRIAVP
jgi:hypothetical protein